MFGELNSMEFKMIVIINVDQIDFRIEIKESGIVSKFFKIL